MPWLVPSPALSIHLTVPSAASWRVMISGRRISASSFSSLRKAFARSVIASKSVSARLYIHWKSWRARKAVPPRGMHQAARSGRVRPSRLTRASLIAPSAGMDVGLREEIRDFSRGVLERIGTVHGVGLDALGQV